MDTMGSRIRSARIAKGLTQDHIADAFRISRVSVTQWEGDITKPALGRVNDLADMLGVTPEWLLGRKVEEDAAPKERRKASLPRVAPVPGGDLIGARDFPVYAAAMGGDGHLIVSFEQIETVKRPAILDGVRNAYGLLINGDSMRPAFNHGDMALVHPGLPVARDKVHIFYDHPPFGRDGEVEAIVKNLTGWTEGEWQLEQYNPAKTYAVHRADWPTAHRVVGRYDAR